MHVSIGMSSAAFMVYFSVDVCVCVYVWMCVVVFVHTCTWTAVGKVFWRQKLFSTIGRKLSTILVTALCLCAAPAFEYSPLKKCTRLIAFFQCPGLFCCTEIGLLNIMWMYAFSCWNSIKQLEKLIFDQAVSYCLELICLKYYLPLILSYISHTPH